MAELSAFLFCFRPICNLLTNLRHNVEKNVDFCEFTVN